MHSEVATEAVAIIGIGGIVDGDGRNAEFLRRASDTHSNFATISDEDTFDNGLCPLLLTGMCLSKIELVNNGNVCLHLVLLLFIQVYVVKDCLEVKMPALRTIVIVLLLFSGVELQAAFTRAQFIAKFKAAAANLTPALPRAAQEMLAATAIFCSGIGMAGCDGAQIVKPLINPLVAEVQGESNEGQAIQAIVIDGISYRISPNRSVDSAFIDNNKNHGVSLFLQHSDHVINHQPDSDHHDIGLEVYFVGNKNERITYLQGKIVRIYSIYYEIAVENKLYDPDIHADLLNPYTIIAWKKRTPHGNVISFINIVDIIN